MEHMFSRKLRGQLNMLKSKCTQTIEFRYSLLPVKSLETELKYF